MPFRYREAMVEPPEKEERDWEKEMWEREAAAEDSYDRDLDDKEWVKRYNEKKRKISM